MDTAEPRWKCGKCKRALGTDDGCITFSYPAWHKYRREVKAWNEAHADSLAIPSSEYESHPRRVHWRVRHYLCDEPGTGAYTIDIERIQTWAQVGWWTAHLFGKTWFKDTDWSQLLGSAGVWEVPS